MDPELSNEWTALQFMMRDRLRSKKYVDLFGYTELLQYAVFPSFENPWSWDILQKTHGDDVAVWKTTWRFDIDNVAFSSPIERLKHPRPFKPTVESLRLDVDHQSACEVLERFYGLSVPMHASGHLIGLDGTSYELQIGSSFCACHLKWWVEIPKTWESIKGPICELERLLMSAPKRENEV
jgi:hypothetical protein